jgi:predicted glycosyltransferase involved in capsule biosynthesis
MQKLLTIGMATYDDFDGVFFSIQALRLYQLRNLKPEEIEFIVIDNNPDSSHGKDVKGFVENWVKGKYIPFKDKKSTSVRNEIFKNASGKYTLCMDSHVLFEQNGIDNLIEYYKQNPDTKNLIQGPLWYDDLVNISTHFDPVWRDIMYGIWGTDKESYEKGEPFEIPMMGLGMFSCKTSEWPGFNENFKGFGGEEGYIHEKIRQRGGKCICLPGIKWNHRFNRPNGVPYPNTLEDRIWNYFVGWLELLKDPKHEFIETIVKTFSERVPEDKVRAILQKTIENINT